MKLFTLLTAAASLLIVSACASTPAPTDERVKVIESDSATDIEPGNIYIFEDAAKVFTLRDIESEINESGYLAVRVFGKTAELSALKWAFFGDIEYDFCYRFYWFDADGNLLPIEVVDRLRSTIPGDPVRFVGHAPTEECRNFALVLGTADDAKLLASSGKGGNVTDGEAAESAEKDIETEILEDAETVEPGDATVPTLPQENVSGDKNDVKVIGVPSTVPAAVPADQAK